KRAVAKAIPDLRQEPPDRAALLGESSCESRAVAKARRVPKYQRVVFLRFDQRIARRFLRHVLTVAHDAHVASQKRARERGLPCVGVRDQRQRDRGMLIHARSAIALSSAFSALVISGADRSTNTVGT